MRKLLNVLQRGLMLVLTVMPLAVLLFRALISRINLGIYWLAVQTLAASLAGMLPAYVGNYTETEVIRYEGGRASNDPNPDREAVHEIVRQGHRIPVRLPAAIIAILVDIFLCMMLPPVLFSGGLMSRLIFTSVMTVLLMTGLYSASSYCIFTEIPGMVFGFLIYLGCALYLNFSARDNSDIQLVISLCALIYLFMGGVCLNRSVLMGSAATGNNTHSTPSGILRKNRNIVMVFIGAAAAISFIGPLRKGAEWLFAKFVQLLRIIGKLLGGGGQDTYDDTMIMNMMGGYTDSQGAQIVEEPSDPGNALFVYIFFAVIGIALLWIIFDALRKLIKKLSRIIEKFAAGINEGYYDVREEIADPSEGKNRLSGMLIDRLKKLVARETPWEKLSPREKARRLLKDIYAKRGRKVNGLRYKTAKEAIDEMKLGSTGLTELYDSARYSEHEISADEPDSIRKEIKP